LSWKIESLSNTTVEPGETLKYFVEPRNLGPDSTDSSQPITISAELPTGMTALSARVFHGSGFFIFPCTAVNGVDPVDGASEIRCTTSESLNKFDLLQLELDVAVDETATGTLVSKFIVSGGGGGEATTIDPIRVGSPPDFGIDSFDGLIAASSTGNPSLQAGAHPYSISTTIHFNTVKEPGPLRGNLRPVEATRDVIADLPPGLVGNPTGAEECMLAMLSNAVGTGSMPLCPPESQVGTTVVYAFNPSSFNNYGPLPVFNLSPPSGVPARFGFAAFGSVVVLDAEVRTGGDYGLSVAAHHVPWGIPVAGTEVTFWGDPSDASHDGERACPGKLAPGLNLGPSCPTTAPSTAFLRNPTSCQPPGVGLKTTLRMDSWEHPGVFTEASYASHLPPGAPLLPGEWGTEQGMSGCEAVPFDPSFQLQPAAPMPASPSGFSVDLSLPQSDDPDSIGQSDLRKAVIALPEGVRVSPSSAHGLGACSSAQIGLSQSLAPACPDSSKIGTATIETPLLDEALSGSVFLAAPHDNPFGSLLAVYIVVEGSGVVIKLPGKVSADPSTGQLTTIFDDNPQLPFSRFHVEFNGGPTAPLTTPRRCGTYTTHAVFTGWSGKVVPVDSSFTLSQDGQGAACPGPRFSPTMTAGTDNPLAGKFSPLQVLVSRNDEDEELSRISVEMPPGLTGKLKGIPYCPDTVLDAASLLSRSGAAELAAPACPAASQVGTVTAGAGAGANPFYVRSGKAFLAGPYKGAPLSLAVTVPALAGPFDLGTVLVRNAIEVDPADAHLTVKSDPLPTILQGIPLDLRDVRVAVNRRDFVLNPTSCERMAVDGVIDSTRGSTARVASRFQVAGCNRLGFKPKLSLRLKGGTKRSKFPALLATLRMPGGSGSNIARAAVTLPHSMFLAQAHIDTICTRVQFAADQCPSGSVYGRARAFTPLLDKPLEGRVYLRSNGGERKLPDLVAALDGQIDLELVGYLGSSKVRGGRGIRTTFQHVPDAPISKFTLKMRGGRKGLVENSVNLCRGEQHAIAKFDAHNGKIRDLTPKIKVSCGGDGRESR